MHTNNVECNTWAKLVCSVPSESESFELLAVAGTFRDVLMHGSRVEKDTFVVKDTGIIDVLAFQPFKIANELHLVLCV